MVAVAGLVVAAVVLPVAVALVIWRLVDAERHDRQRMGRDEAERVARRDVRDGTDRAAGRDDDPDRDRRTTRDRRQ